MKKRILACLLALVMLIGVLPVMALAEDSSAAVSVSDGKAKVASKGDKVDYDTLDAAMAAAKDGDTIYLGKGTYCGNAANPTVRGKGAGKSLTFVGVGTGETTWQIRALDEPAVPADGPCDYSFEGCDRIAFENMTIIGDVKDKDVILVDDMVDTAGTICKAANLMKENGARSVRALASHAIMSDPASQRIDESALTEMIFSNSIPMNKDCKKVTILSIANLFADTIRRVHENQSISSQYLIK